MNENDLPSNWGRWGEDDQIGTLHLIDDAARARAAAEVQTGTSVSLARPTRPAPLTTGLSPVGGQGTVPAPVAQVVNFNGFTPLAITDSLLINTHHAGLTHVDAPVHMPVEGRVYPGVAIGDAMTPTGARHGSADHLAAGILTRGVLLDLAPDGRLAADRRIGASDLEEARERARTEVHPGDAIVVRSGCEVDQPMDQPVPGLDLSAVAWLHEHDVSLYVGDTSDARPPSLPLPMHQVALARLGLPLVDAAELDALARTCTELQRWSFLLVLAPPRITGTTGLAVNPLAVF